MDRWNLTLFGTVEVRLPSVPSVDHTFNCLRLCFGIWRYSTIFSVSQGLAIAEGDEFNDMTILDKYPHQIFDSMTSAEVDEMLVDIQNFQKNDIVHKGFWKAMGYVCQDAVEIKIREKTVGNMRVAGGFGVGVAEGDTCIGSISEATCMGVA